jgi:hypothetical protein
MANGNAGGGMAGKGSNLVKITATTQTQKDMKTTTPSPFRFAAWEPPARVIALSVFVFAAQAMAQQVLVPPPAFSPAPQLAFSPEEGGEESGATISKLGSIFAPRNLFQWGPVTVHPRVNYGFVRANGVQSQPGTSQTTEISQVTPGIGFNLGKHWMLDYNAAARFYSDKNFHNSVDHSVNLSGTTIYEDWEWSLSQSCGLSSAPQTETAQQTDLQNYSTSLSVSRQLTREMSLVFGISQTIQNVQGLTNSVGGSRSWSTLDWLRYQWAPNLGAGVGAGFGYVNVDAGSDMTFEQIQAETTWRVVHKLSLSVNGGVDIRQILDSAQPDLISPVFGVAIKYAPFDVTTIDLNATRSLSPSSFRNQLSEGTIIALNVRQRLLKRFQLGLSGSYGYTSYQTTAPETGASVQRTDNYTALSVSLSTAILNRGSATVFYSLGQNSSTQSRFTYTSNQVGFQLGLSY